MAKMFYEKDAPLKALKGKKVAVVGYGSQGHAHSQNVRDSGIEVAIAELKGTANYKIALKHGFKPTDIKTAIKDAALIIITLPDEIQGKVFKTQIEPNLAAGQTLGFCHGFNIHFKYIVPPKGVNGGHDSPGARTFKIGRDGHEERLPGVAQVTLEPGEWLRGIDNSGGGYGDPLERDAARVCYDVAERWETLARAAEIYGVVLNRDDSVLGYGVDQAATSALRAQRLRPNRA